MKVFVYGTLMGGLQREEALSNSLFLGFGYINGTLYNLGNYPGLKDGNDKVFGELYEISLPTLNYLDQIEGYFTEQPENSLYIRKSTIIYSDPTAETCIAETYFYNLPVVESNRIVTGDYRAFLGLQKLSEYQ